MLLPMPGNGVRGVRLKPEMVRAPEGETAPVGFTACGTNVTPEPNEPTSGLSSTTGVMGVIAVLASEAGPVPKPCAHSYRE